MVVYLMRKAEKEVDLAQHSAAQPPNVQWSLFHIYLLLMHKLYADTLLYDFWSQLFNYVRIVIRRQANVSNMALFGEL